MGIGETELGWMNMRKKSEKIKRSFYAPVAGFIGMKLVTIGRGRAVVTLKAKPHHENTVGTVHGGILCDLADAAMGYAFESSIPRERHGVTVEFKINFLHPAYAGDALHARALVVAHGRSLYYLECEIKNSKKVLIAKSSGTCKILSAMKVHRRRA